MAAAITPAQLAQLIHDRKADVDAALQEVSPVGARLGIVELEPVFGVSAETDASLFAERVLAYLKMVSLIDEFSAIVSGQQVDLLTPDDLANMQMDPAVGERMARQTAFARCAIYRGGDFQGSGCLLGPSLVLTCAHVLGEAKDDAYPETEVLLANNARIGTDSVPVSLSPVSGADSKSPLSALDDDFADGHDYALLRLRVPAGRSTAIVELPAEEWKPSKNAALTVLHFPNGTDNGMGLGHLGSFSKPSMRWGYVGPAKNGSSGGACFNSRGELIGIHQGKFNGFSRLVPFSLFRDKLADAVANDISPDYLWSLDGRLEGPLVIGRADLFQCFAIMARSGSPYRMLRIKRSDPTVETSGMGYSIEIVRRLVDRQPNGHRAIILAWPQALHDDFDLVTQLVEKAQDQQLVSAEAGGEAAGVASGETGSATVAKGRIEGLLQQLNDNAEKRGETIWIVVEHATINLGTHTVSLETLASLTPRWPRLRMVLVGNEVLSLPEPEFRISDVSDSTPARVALVEYLGLLDRSEVEAFIRAVYTDFLGDPPKDKWLQAKTDAALDGADMVANRYAPSGLSGIVARLRATLAPLDPEPTP
jgi:hypothetical protein